MNLFRRKNNTPKKLHTSHFLSLSEKYNPDRLLLLIFTKTRRQFLTRIAILFTKLGNGQAWLLFSLIIMVYSVPIGVSFHISALLQLYGQIFLKNLVKRTRPYLVYQDLDYLYAPPDPFSFPSGHTAAAFTMAFTAKLVFPVAWPFFLLIALIIAFSRVYLAVHYPSDVFAGIILAYFAAKYGTLLSQVVTGIMI